MSTIDGQTKHGMAITEEDDRRPDRAAVHALYDMVSTHADRENAVLDAYQRLVEKSEDEGLRYLVRLIMDDETRHHQQASEMLNELHSFVNDLDVQPRLPSLGARHDDALREQTDRLLAIEKEDAKELQRLRKELRGNGGYALFSLLVNLMVHDTAKHIEILKFIR
ncbi:MAG TPA: hypothetical protein VND62_09545 [Acidimicrobiales bacterium]|nr:hypothetical protein [Acidimicrobiales bacterium]